MPVRLEVVKEVLVERILSEALARYPPRPSAPVARALEATLDLPACDGGALDLRLRRLGYLTRVIEVELFEAAREPIEGLAQELARRLAGGLDWPFAAAAVSLELARREPLPRPRPDDELAVSWRVPGPGGHVRHYLVSAAIADALGEEGGGRALPPGIAEAGELKRCWTYGFLVRCCEEALAPAALVPSVRPRSR